MRETCQSGSMSGNRKQNQVKPDCGDAAKASSNTTGRLQSLRLFSTLLPIVQNPGGWGILSEIACSIKGNVKENICPSTGSEEPLLDFQPLAAMKDA